FRSTMAQIWLPSLAASTDCDGCRVNGSLLTAFQVAPWSFETSTPPAVAAYHASVPNAMPFTKYAVNCGPACFGVTFGAAPFLPLVVFATATVAGSGTYSPARTHLCAASSYFIHPPLVSVAHQPVGAAYT